MKLFDPYRPGRRRGRVWVPTAQGDAEGGSGDWFALLYEVVVLYATRPATARSWTRVPAWNPKIGFGLSPDPDRPGRRRGQIWRPVCRALRGCLDS